MLDPSAPSITLADVQAAAASGQRFTAYPVGFDPGIALAAGGGRAPTAWAGTVMRGGQPVQDANRRLNAREWWGTPGRIGILDAMVAEEPTAQAMRLAMTLPLLAKPWTMEPPEDASPQELEAADFARTALFEHLVCDDGWHGWIEQAVQYQWQGFQPSEVYWPYDRELKRTLLGLRPLLPSTINAWERSGGDWSLKQWPETGDGATSGNGVQLQPDDFVNLRYMPRGSNPAPMGAFRPAWGDYMASCTYRTLEAQGFQRAAYGVPTIEVDPSKPGFDGTQTTVDAVNLAAQNYRSGLLAAQMMPPGYRLTFQDFPFRGDFLREAITAKRHSMLLSVLATFLRTGETKGALSLHDGQVLFFSGALQQAADKIARVLSMGSQAPIKRLVARNFPDVRRFPFLVAPRVQIGDPSALIAAIVGALEKGAVVDDDRSIEASIREALSLPGRQEGAAGPVSPDAVPDASAPDRGDAEDEVEEEIADEQEDAVGAAESDTHVPPQAVQDAAAKALRVRAEKPASERGMTSIGLARARDLSNGTAISIATIRRMKAYFDRHEIDKRGSTWDDQGKGWQAWHGWGGDAGRAWANRILEREDRVDGGDVRIVLHREINNDSIVRRIPYDSVTYDGTLSLADTIEADRPTRGPRGRGLYAAEEAIRWSETGGRTDAAKREQARIVYEWRQRIAEPYGHELSTAADLEDANRRPVPGQKELAELLAAGLRRVYRAGGEAVRNEIERIEADPDLRKRIARGDAEVGRGGDLPAPARAADCSCGCCGGEPDPYLVRLSLSERMAEPFEPSDGMALALPKRKAIKPTPATDMPESLLDEIDPEDAISAVARTTAAAQAGKVRGTATAALQAQGIGGTLPRAGAIPSVVAGAVKALAESSDLAQAQGDINTIFGLGRSQEQRAEGAETYLYSALLESQSCDPCLSHDGEVFGAGELDEHSTPASWCEGGDRCNCLSVGLPPEGSE
jgi:hypothetical protein